MPTTEIVQPQPGSALAAFNAGMHDGYHGEPRKKNQGGFYNRAWRKGVEGRAREVNGGEDTTPRRAA